jgi:hypothetical protein
MPGLTLHRRTARGASRNPRVRSDRLQALAFWLVFAAVVGAVCVLVPIGTVSR